mgnify:FL=1
MDIGRAFTYPFEDKDWLKKIGIGGLVNIIPVLGQMITQGYALRQLKNQAAGRELPLPEWDNWGGDLAAGAKILIGLFIYALPAVLVSIVASVIIAATADASSDSPSTISTICACGQTIVQVVWGLFVAIISPAAILNFARQGESIGSFFKIKDVIALTKANTKEYAMVVIMSVVVNLVAGLVGGIICGIGTLFTMVIANLAVMHLLAQYNNIISGVAATPVAPVIPEQ